MKTIMNTNRLFILGLCLLCLTVYFNSLNNPFILDDEALVVNNPFIKSSKFLTFIFKKSPYDYSWQFVNQSFNKKYRPLQLLTYSIDYKIWKLNPLGYHLTNIFIHLFNSILIYYLLLSFFNNTFSQIISILFLIHPIHTSVVSYIASRADLLVSLFILSSIISFLKFIKLKLKTYYVISLLFAVLALLSRENALTLFMFIILILFILKARPKQYLYVLPFILLDVLYFCLRFLIFGGYAISMHKNLLSLPLRVVNFFNIIPRYLSILVFPLNLHFFRTTPFILRLLDIRVFFAITFALFFTAVIIRFRNNKLLLFSIFWFLIGIIPAFFYMDGYALLGEAMMAESWLYLSSVGSFIIFVSILKTLKILKNLQGIILTCIIIFYSFSTLINNFYWKNDIIFYKNILDFSSAIPIRSNLINIYLRRGLYEDALEEIKKFEIYYPNSPEVYLLWGNYYLLTDQLNMAIDNYNKVLSRNKDFYAYYGLSLCYGKLNELNKSMDFSLECFKLSPYYIYNLIQLGDLYSQKKQFIEAKKYYRMALDFLPENRTLKDKLENIK